MRKVDKFPLRTSTTVEWVLFSTGSTTGAYMLPMCPQVKPRGLAYQVRLTKVTLRRMSGSPVCECRLEVYSGSSMGYEHEAVFSAMRERLLGEHQRPSSAVIERQADRHDVLSVLSLGFEVTMGPERSLIRECFECFSALTKYLGIPKYGDEIPTPRIFREDFVVMGEDKGPASHLITLGTYERDKYVSERKQTV